MEVLRVSWGDRFADAHGTIIPNLLLDHYHEIGLAPAEFALLCHILRHKDLSVPAGNDREWPYLSVEKTAAQMGISDRAVREMLHGLEEKGFLARKPRLGRPSIMDLSGLREALINLPPPEESSPRRREGVGGQPTHHPGTQVPPRNSSSAPEEEEAELQFHPGTQVPPYPQNPHVERDLHPGTPVPPRNSSSAPELQRVPPRNSSSGVGRNSSSANQTPLSDSIYQTPSGAEQKEKDSLREPEPEPEPEPEHIAPVSRWHTPAGTMCQRWTTLYRSDGTPVPVPDGEPFLEESAGSTSPPPPRAPILEYHPSPPTGNWSAEELQERVTLLLSSGCCTVETAERIARKPGYSTRNCAEIAAQARAYDAARRAGKPGRYNGSQVLSLAARDRDPWNPDPQFLEAEENPPEDPEERRRRRWQEEYDLQAAMADALPDITADGPVRAGITDKIQELKRKMPWGQDETEGPTESEADRRERFRQFAATENGGSGA